MRVSDLLAASPLPRADAEVLLARSLARDRSWLLAHGDDVLSIAPLHVWREWESRRLRHEPVSYIVGEKEFMGRSFTVDPHVLIPRPSTENLVALLFRFLDRHVDEEERLDAGILGVARRLRPWCAIGTIADVGTGSGCIAVTVACEHPRFRVLATDVSDEALHIARRNAHRWHVDDRIEFRRGGAFDPLANVDEPFVVVSNPPYISSFAELMPDVVMHEPPLALRAGAEGTDVLVRLATAAAAHPHCIGIVLECETQQRRTIDTALGRTG